VSSFANFSGVHEFERDMKKYKCWNVNFWTAVLLCVIEHAVPFFVSLLLVLWPHNICHTFAVWFLINDYWWNIFLFYSTFEHIFILQYFWVAHFFVWIDVSAVNHFPNIYKSSPICLLQFCHYFYYICVYFVFRVWMAQMLFLDRGNW